MCKQIWERKRKKKCQKIDFTLSGEKYLKSCATAKRVTSLDSNSELSVVTFDQLRYLLNQV